jgi:hypothetical protein
MHPSSSRCPPARGGSRVHLSASLRARGPRRIMQANTVLPPPCSSSSQTSPKAASDAQLPLFSRLSMPVYSLSTQAPSGSSATLNLITYAAPISLQPRRYALGLYLGTLSHENFKLTKRGVLQVRPGRCQCRVCVCVCVCVCARHNSLSPGVGPAKAARTPLQCPWQDKRKGRRQTEAHN